MEIKRNVIKVVGKVTSDERDEIQDLFERLNGLNELSMILSPKDVELNEKLVVNKTETDAAFQDWWNRMSEKYQWERIEEGNWEINYATREIMFTKP